MKLDPGERFPDLDLPDHTARRRARLPDDAGPGRVGYDGAITVTREPVAWREDPFARIFPGTGVRTDGFSAVAPPPDPVLERYAGVAWPGGRFGR